MGKSSRKLSFTTLPVEQAVGTTLAHDMTRAIPLVITRADLHQAVALAKADFPIFSMNMFLPLKIRLIVTGDEIYKGLVQDRFRDIVNVAYSECAKEINGFHKLFL